MTTTAVPSAAELRDLAITTARRGGGDLDAVAGDHHLAREVVLERPQGQQLVVGVILDQEDDLLPHLTTHPSK